MPMTTSSSTSVKPGSRQGCDRRFIVPPFRAIAPAFRGQQIGHGDANLHGGASYPRWGGAASSAISRFSPTHTDEPQLKSVRPIAAYAQGSQLKNQRRATRQQQAALEHVDRGQSRQRRLPRSSCSNPSHQVLARHGTSLPRPHGRSITAQRHCRTRTRVLPVLQQPCPQIQTLFARFVAYATSWPELIVSMVG
jgi:hypothetical protein